MSHLTHRAEQALLGALLVLPDPPPDILAVLRSEDFGHRGHQQVFTAVLELQEQQPWLKGEDRLTAVAARVRSPGTDRQWLEQLREQAARPAHLEAYTQMIQTAALRRDVAAHAERIAGHQLLPDLAQSLLRQSRAYENLRTADPEASVPVWYVRAAQSAQADVDAWLRAPEGRAIREDWLLADLLHHPEQASALARILPDEAFSTPQRREVYRVLLNLGETGKPIDAVIVAWELETQRALEQLYPSEDPPAFEPIRTSDEPDVVYLSRLASTPSTMTATELGRDLIADDLRTQLADLAATPQTHGPRDPEAIRPGPGTRSPLPLDPGRHRPPPPPEPGFNPRPSS